MKTYLEYKGYRTRIEFDPTAWLLHGKIDGISDLVTFESTDTAQIENEFHAAVDDYLDFCKEIGKYPKKHCDITEASHTPRYHASPLG